MSTCLYQPHHALGRHSHLDLLQDASRSEAGPFLPDSERLPHPRDYAPSAAFGGLDMHRLDFRWIFFIFPLSFFTFASQHGDAARPWSCWPRSRKVLRAHATSLDAAPGHCVSARVSQLAGAKAGRTLGVPAVDLRVRWGHQRSVTVTMSTLTEGAIRRVASMDLRRGF